MPTGFAAFYKGRLQTAQLYLKAGHLHDAATGIGGFIGKAGQLVMTVTAAGNTDYTLAIPPGATLLRATCFTSVAFGAGTDALLSIGPTPGDASYVAPVSIKAIGIYPLTWVAAAAADLLSLPASPLCVRIAQTGAPSAVGQAILAVEHA
jgi:hypothetical protein